MHQSTINHKQPIKRGSAHNQPIYTNIKTQRDTAGYHRLTESTSKNFLKKGDPFSRITAVKDVFNR